MKVLWFSNCVLADTSCSGSGSWLFGMKSIISGHVELYNITSSNVTDITKNKAADITEYVLPDYQLYDGIPSKDNISIILQLISEISPDIIHIWGIEKYWCRLYQRGYIKGHHVLLEIQGVLSSCGNSFYGGLFPKEIISTYGVRELLRPMARLDKQYKDFRNRASDEELIIKAFAHISTQSSWTRNQIKFLTSPNCRIYETLRPIRKEFYESRKWELSTHDSPVIYTSVSYSYPFKGLHVVIRAMGLVVRKYPNAKLIIAGFDGNKPFYKDNGYNRFLKSLINDLGLSNNMELPGKLKASDIINQLLESDIFVNPSFVESYSASAAEALFLGVPSLLSYAGAMPNFSENGDVALYYSPMDYVDCAAKILTMFENKQETQLLSDAAKKRMEQKSSREAVLNKQIEIYNEVLNG